MPNCIPLQAFVSYFMMAIEKICTQPATLRLLEFTTILLTNVLCLCPHILSFLTRAGCGPLNLETDERSVVTKTLDHTIY